MERRVVITAASAITPIGHGKKDIVDSLLQGRSGVIPLRDDHLLSGYIDCKVYGTINYPMDFDFERKYRKTMGPVSYYACQVVKEVLESSGLEKAFHLFREPWCRIRVHTRKSHGSTGNIQEFLQPLGGPVRRCRRRGLSEIDGPHHRGQHYQDV